MRPRAAHSSTGEAIAADGLGGQSNGTSGGNVVERAFQPAILPHGHHAGDARYATDSTVWLKLFINDRAP